MPNPPDRGRVPLVDALRGFALFGVVVSNMAIMLGAGAAGSEPSPLDTTVERVLAYVVTGKFLALFSLLFAGAGRLEPVVADTIQDRAFRVDLAQALLHGLRTNHG